MTPRMASSPVRFRDASPADGPAVVALVESAYRGGTGPRGWTSEAHLLGGQRTDEAAVSEMVARRGSVIILALTGDLAGCCHLERLDPLTAHFGLFAVRPDRQGRGIGRAVLEEARRRAGGWGCRRMRMTVIRQRADLIAWYSRRGFAPTGATEPFPYGDERFGRPRRDDLEFVVLESELARPGPGRGSGP